VEHPFDPTLMTLAELAPVDWLPLAKRRRCRVTIEDSDIGTLVSGATDKRFRVHGLGHRIRLPRGTRAHR
jgi:hypothetical protein